MEMDINLLTKKIIIVKKNVQFQFNSGHFISIFRLSTVYDVHFPNQLLTRTLYSFSFLTHFNFLFTNFNFFTLVFTSTINIPAVIVSCTHV